MEFNADKRHEIGTKIYIKCNACCMISEQIVIPSSNENMQSSQCTECENVNEWTI